MPPPYCNGEVYCFPRRQLIFRFGGVSYIIQNLSFSTPVLIPNAIILKNLVNFKIIY